MSPTRRTPTSQTSCAEAPAPAHPQRALRRNLRPRGLAADVTNLGLWGNGDVQLEVDNARQVPYAMELVRQAFAAKQTPHGPRQGERRLVDSWEGSRGPWSSRTLLNWEDRGAHPVSLDANCGER